MVAIVIGDVCDKGVGAALFMVLFRSLIRAFSRVEINPQNVKWQIKEIVSKTNDYIETIHGDARMFASEDWFPTLVGWAGNTKAKDELLKGTTVEGKPYKVHLDGYDQNDLLTGKGPTKRHNFFYWSDDGDLLAMRHDRWKFHFMIQEHETGMGIRITSYNVCYTKLLRICLQ